MNEKRAVPKERFTILSITIQIQGQGPTVILSRHADKWTCLCDDYRENRDCSHVLAAEMLLDDLLTVKEGKYAANATDLVPVA